MNAIAEVQREDPTVANASQEAKLQGELNEWLRRNEILWRQKSRETWLKDGDKNSRFFHISSIIRRKRNSIDAIKDDSGEWLICKKDIREHVVDKFFNLFTEEPVDFPSDLNQLILPAITDEGNLDLCSIPSHQDIKNMIFVMGSQKAPGPDGLPTLFYKKYWNVVGNSVIEAIQNCFSSGKLL